MRTQVAIVGGGPGGSVAALNLARKGIETVVVEKQKFPRFHIGESMTGECGKVLRRLGLEPAMVGQGHPVKLGVKVYAPNGKGSFFVPVMDRSDTGELVDASTWQVRRSGFDAMLLDQAVAAGAELLHGSAVAPVTTVDGAVRGLRVRPVGSTAEVQVDADVVVDASGLHTFLANAGVTSRKERGNYDRQLAIYSHFTGLERDRGDHGGDTLIFYKQRHHWSWWIPLDAETVSIGVVVPSEVLHASSLAKRDFLLHELRTLNPALAERTAGAEMVEETHATSNYSYHVKQFTGDGWLCVGDAHRFIDPIFSFGLGVSVSEAGKAAAVIEAYLGGHGGGGANPFLGYQAECERGIDVYQLMVDGFWVNPLGFAYLLHNRHTDDLIDIFAGRVYGEMRSPGYLALQALIGDDGAMALVGV